MKKFRYLLMVGILSMVVDSCVGGSNFAHADRVAQLEDSIRLRVESKEETQKTRISADTPSTSVENALTQSGDTTNPDVGLYEFTDEAGDVYIIELNSDKTAILKNQTDGHIFYASWYRQTRGGLELTFSFDDMPYIIFPNPSNRNVIKDGYIYKDVSAAKTRNHNKRLPIKKIK